MPCPTRRSLLLALALLAAGAAGAQPAPLAVHGAWARPSVPGQTSSAVYLTLTAAEPLTLVGISTPVAATADVHEMKLDGDVMRMRAVPVLALPAGRPVQFKPGGLHLMLQDLKAPLQPDTRIALTLTLRDARGGPRQLTLQVPVSATPPRDAAAAASQGGHRH